MNDKLPLKDRLINKERIDQIASEVGRAYPAFDGKAFANKVTAKLPELELKARIEWVADNLKEFLPDNYSQAVKTLVNSLPPHNDAALADSDFGYFTYAPHSAFVARYGCSKEHLAISLESLQEMTKRFSAEDAMRYFINAFPAQTMAKLLEWSRDKDYHVRRLASECTRPTLPWSPKINISIDTAIPILDNLFLDSNRFVTRSVANHMNDIAKKDSDLAIATLKRWQDSDQQNAKEMKFIIAQALRSLIKNGHQATLEFLNISTKPAVAVSGLSLQNDSIKIGDHLEFNFKIKAFKDEQLIIDYILHFAGKTGNSHNKKVFKLKNVMMAKGQELTIAKRQPMSHMSTRKLNPGSHRLEIQVNGNKLAEAKFELSES